MTNILKHTFYTTNKELEKDIKWYQQLYDELKLQKGCVTCKHCIHIQDFPGFITGEENECDIGFNCDTVLHSIINCDSWEEKVFYDLRRK